MIDNLNQNFTQIEEFPKHTDYQGNWDAYALEMMNKLKQLPSMSSEMISFISKLETMINQANVDIDLINNLSDLIEGLLDYKGEYIGDSIYHFNESVSIGNDKYISKIDNNTDTPPSTNWLTIPKAYSTEKTDELISNIDLTLAEQTKSYSEDEESILTLSKPVSSPLVIVRKEVIQEGLINDKWGVDVGEFEQETDLLDIVNNSISITTSNVLIQNSVADDEDVKCSYANNEYVVTVCGSGTIIIEDVHGNTINSFTLPYSLTKDADVMIHSVTGHIWITYKTGSGTGGISTTIYDIDGNQIKAAFSLNTSVDGYSAKLLEFANGNVLVKHYDYNGNTPDYAMYNSVGTLIKSNTSADTGGSANSIYIESPLVLLDDDTAMYFYLLNGGALYYTILSNTGTILGTYNMGMSILSFGAICKLSNGNIAIVYRESSQLYATIIDQDGNTIVAVTAFPTYYPYRIKVAPLSNGSFIVVSGRYDVDSTDFFTASNDLSSITQTNLTSTKIASDNERFTISSVDDNFFIMGNDDTNTIRYYSTYKYTPISTFIPTITDISAQINTDLWATITSIEIDETLNNQTIYYALSEDNKTSFSIFLNGSGSRKIVRFNVDTWEYNSNETYANETWVAATTNNMYQALSEAMSVATNQMDSTQLAAISENDFFELGITLDLAAMLYTNSNAETPVFNGMFINYDGNSEWEYAQRGVDYSATQLSDTQIRITSLASNNLKTRISK